MPVRVPDGLPAIAALEQEGVVIIPESRAFKQDIRPLKIAILNIMPIKDVAETQFLRLLCHSPLQVEVTFLRPTSHESQNTSAEHLTRFYKSFSDVKNERFDCLIISGAPLGKIDFTEVTYWEELCDIMEWSSTHVFSTFHVCWGAVAGLFFHYNLPKLTLPQKLTGVFEHVCLKPANPLLRGFDDTFYLPHSRFSAVGREAVVNTPALQILGESERAGVALVSTKDSRRVFILGHPEYEQFTLKEEYERDLKRGELHYPEQYFRDEDATRPPKVSWRSHATLLFSNWLNAVYQQAPHDLRRLEPVNEA